ncbi:MAG: class I SAM-dependent methyltransferase [Candidatus Portnoybacteria bacterium]|nr:class I SAM-dependent methyltransferase [Candidatus Portnoybacteria bacterium]
MSYNHLAKFYDFFVEDESMDLFVDFIKIAIKKYCPNAKNILELGSGTGNILVLLSKQFRTFGIDSSKEMVELAKKKDSKTIYRIQDMKNLNLQRKFEVIISMFDTINHLTKLKDWQIVFNKTREHLEDGGLFIFDINTEYQLDEIAKQRFFITDDTKGNIIVLEKIKKRNLLSWQFKIFINQKNGFYKLQKENIDEVSFPLIKIKKSLINEGFKILSVTEIDGSSIRPKSKRAFFVCQKLV